MQDALNDELIDAASELLENECPRLAAAVERARQRLYPNAPASGVQVNVEPECFEDTETGQIVLNLGEACHA